jgi:hypothetical protein
MRRFSFKKNNDSVPVGKFRARFLEVEDTTHPEFGAGVAWKFKILDGPQKGQVTSRVTSPEPTRKNSCGAMIRSLAGGRVDEGAEIDVDQFIGREYLITVGENSTGTGTRVENVMPAVAGPGVTREPGDEGAPF